MKLRETQRAMQAAPALINSEARTAELSFSSEAAVPQYFGREVLSHAAGACDLSRLQSGAPLLFNHNRDAVIGVVEGARIGEDKRGYATVRFSRSPAGEQALQDVKDNILRNVSVNYRILDMKQSAGTRQNPEFTVTKWQPNEISLVSVPADPSVGIGRAGGDAEHEVSVAFLTTDDPMQAGRAAPTEHTLTATAVAAPDAAAIDAARAQAATDERARIAAIDGLGTRLGRAELARKLIQDGASMDAARAAFLEALGVQQAPVADATAPGFIDGSAREMQQYSVIRAIRAATDNSWKQAGFELECSAHIAKRAGKDTNGFFMPVNLPMDGLAAEAARQQMQRTTSATAYAATSGSTGGSNIVATNLLAGSFINVLRNKARVFSLGARLLTGLVGNVAIPRQASATAVYWISTEGGEPTEAEGTFDLVTLTPKTMGAYSMVTRQMLLQSTPDIEMLVRDDLAAVMGLGIDLAAISGAGSSGQPKGILNTSGIGSVAMGTNGGAATIDSLIALETALMTANVDENNLAYFTNAKQIGALKTLKDTTGRYLWNQFPGVFGQRTSTPGEINGYPVVRSNQVPATLTKGSGTNLSAILFANWSELFIGEWGVLEIVPNPYGAGYKSGSIEIRSLQTVDVQLRHAASFAAITDAI